jgi:hypothetical protein
VNEAAKLGPAPWPGGAEVMRLRTEDGAPIRGHALLIGAPLAGLRGVPESLDAVRKWLTSRGFVGAGEVVGSEAASIEEQMSAMIGEVEPGDWVLVYYAGHGMQVLPIAEAHPQPLAVLLPIDAFESRVVIAGDTWMDWMRVLSKKAAPRHGEGPGVVLVLDCCHALALMERWPEAEARAAVMKRIREGLTAHKFRDPTDPLPGVVRVLATGRDDRSDVGEMTSALVRLLDEHPDEPWWALMDRLRGGWTKAQQHPGMSGPIDRVPLSSERFERPVGLVPCVLSGDEWRVELAGAMGWTSHRRLALTPSLRVPAQTWAELEADGHRLRLLEPGHSEYLHPSSFAWAWAAPQGRRAVVVVEGNEPYTRRELAQRLEPLTQMVYEQTPLSRLADDHGLVSFTANGNAVEIRDRWGDLVARTSRHDEAAWSAWLDRLLSLDDWLAVAEQGSPWPEKALRMQWGTWNEDGERITWTMEDPMIAARSPVWVEVVAEPWVRGHVSVFRIRADRAVEWVSAHAPGGMSLAGQAVVTIGTRQDPLKLDSHGSTGDDTPKMEMLVALVSDRDLPLSALARGPVGSPAAKQPGSFRGSYAPPRCFRRVIDAPETKKVMSACNDRPPWR